MLSIHNPRRKTDLNQISRNRPWSEGRIERQKLKRIGNHTSNTCSSNSYKLKYKQNGRKKSRKMEGVSPPWNGGGTRGNLRGVEHSPWVLGSGTYNRWNQSRNRSIGPCFRWFPTLTPSLCISRGYAESESLGWVFWWLEPLRQSGTPWQNYQNGMDSGSNSEGNNGT